MDKDKIVFKGSHPDSLYRVPTSNADIAAGKLMRCMRLLRWPLALVTICVALTVFVYFLIPSNMEQSEAQNGTLWFAGAPEAQSNNRLFEEKDKLNYKEQSPKHTNAHGPIKTSEIDFYGADNEKPIHVIDVLEKNTANIPKRILPVPPVFPSHISLEVQYGNEEADSDKIRTGKTFEEVNILPDDSTLKPHITQKPERPLEIDVKNVDTISSTERVLRKVEEMVATAETAVNASDYEKVISENNGFHSTAKKELIINEQLNDKETIPHFREFWETPNETQEFESDLNPINTKVDGDKFTSGHSKFFGMSIEDVAMIKTTTQSSAYKTRVSPTLPTWRDRDGTTKNYPLNLNSDVSECDSTRLPLCRGVLPYDLAGPPASFDGTPITTFLTQIEYLIASNCSSRLNHFVCSLLEPECNAPPFPPVLPCYNLCRAITDSCENYIPRELTAVFNCNRYSSANCLSARGPCYQRELSCRDGSCVPRDWMCDGINDCPGGEDEASCVTCEPQEFRCKSGACILNLWLCDGYIDCEDGSDESIETCAGRGVRGTSAVPGIADEETAGSAPAPSVRRPNRLPGVSRASDLAANENESSKELLITSDSNNALKRNFTRRPPLSRLTPYSRTNLQDKYAGKLANSPIVPMKADQEPLKTTDTQKPKGDDDMTFFSDLAKAAAEMPPINNKQVTVEETNPNYQPSGRAPEPGEKPATRLDKNLNKIERVIDSASMIKITEAPMPPEEYEEYPHRTSGHVSPCPSGELRCVDGRCITLAQLCDGTIDCSDHADEDNCYT